MINFTRKLNAPSLQVGSKGARSVDVAAYLPNPNGDNGRKVSIQPGQVVKISTGYRFNIPPKTGMLILPRSGISTKKQLKPVNSPGLLDEDYLGELFIALENNSSSLRVVSHGDYIAQLVLVPLLEMKFNHITPVHFDSMISERGTNGFGSTEGSDRATYI